MAGVGEGARRGTRRRLTISEAADALGITVVAVRSLIKRGTIAHEREGSRVYVLLDTDQLRPGHDQGGDQAAGEAQPDALIEALDEMREQVRYLREQVQAEREVHAEARRLLLLALERIPPALEPPSQEEPQESSESEARPADERESPEMAMPDHEMHIPEVHGGPLPHDRRSQTPSERRSWWRRMFGS